MKINRQPLVEMTQEVVDRDHQFWSKYSERLIGNWLTYDTSVSNICRVAEQVYIKRNYENLKVDGVDVKPDSRFVRDDDAQKPSPNSAAPSPASTSGASTRPVARATNAPSAAMPPASPATSPSSSA